MNRPHDTRSGRCRACHVRYVWRFRSRGIVRPLRGAHCPRCGDALQATTRLLKAPVSRRFPVYGLTAIAALRAKART